MATIPSLALIPSGFKASKVYSVLPTDGTGDFTFTRSGNATRVNSDGLIELVSSNVPRLNYPLIDGVVQGCPSLLLEPQRININTFSDPTDAQKSSTSYASVTYQDDFNWGLGNVINNAIVFGDNSTTRYAYYNSTVVSGTEYTLSFFIKMDDNSVPIPATDFLLVLAGTSIASGYTIDNYGNNVYRVSVSGTAGASNTANGILKVASHSAKTFKITGFQLEAGSYATSYIPTSGTTATRSAETCNNAGNVNTFNDSEGVLFLELSSLANDGTNRHISISNGNTIQRVYFGFRPTANQFILSSVDSSYVIDIVSNATNFNKFAFKYKSGDFKAFVNGISYNLTLNGGLSPTGLIKLNFNNGAGNDIFYGNVKQIQVFNTGLADTDLETLTSWDSFSDMANGQLYSVE
jgi:hypothetical protein